MGTSPDRLIARLAARQHGVFALAQARAAGIPDHVIRNRLASGRLIQLHRGVYLLAGVPPSNEQTIMASVLAAGHGAAASHNPAAYLWNVTSSKVEVAEVTVPRTMRPRIIGVIVHRSRTLRPADVALIGVIPVTKPTRTIIDLASFMDEDPLEDAFDNLLRRALTTAQAVLVQLEREPTSAGTRNLRRLARERVGGHKGESPPENGLRRLLLRWGLPEPDAQVVIRDVDGRFVARVDLAYREAKVVVEYDSWEQHSGRKHFEDDKVRRNRITRAGWGVLEITDRQIRDSPVEVVRTVADIVGVQVGTLKESRTR